MSHLTSSKSLYRMPGCTLVERLPFILQAPRHRAAKNQHPLPPNEQCATPYNIKKMKQALYSVIIPGLQVRKARLCEPEVHLSGVWTSAVQALSALTSSCLCVCSRCEPSQPLRPHAASPSGCYQVEWVGWACFRSVGQSLSPAPFHPPWPLLQSCKASYTLSACHKMQP